MEQQEQIKSSAKDMQSARMKGLPFKNEQMNFFFVGVMGADVFGGASFGEMYYVAGKIKDGDTNSWIDAFGEIAASAREQGERLLAGGYRESARQAFLRAANYYYAADHYASNRHPKYMSNWEQGLECFHKAAALFARPIEVLEYELDGRKLNAYFIPAVGTPKGTVLAMSGFDGTPEHLYFTCGAGLSQRGYNVLAFEGPGQRGMSHRIKDLPFRTDYETVISRVIDLVLQRADVDPDRLGLLGYSFGGHLVLRAAAVDARIKALIADSPVMDFGKQMLDGFPGFAARGSDWMANLLDQSIIFMGNPLQASLDRLYESMGVNHFSDFRREMAKYRFDEVDRITCPVLCMVSEGEGASAVAEGRMVYEKAPNPLNRLVSFSSIQGADVHCQLNNLAISVSAIADWLDDIWK
jgi:pimeloyl-ACP methyl ester carboxylesterase